MRRASSPSPTTDPASPPEDHDRIFERFWRADPARTRSRGGSGLGLAIVASLVHAHHGEITLDSEPGKGATFVIRLPLAPHLPDTLARADPAALLSPDPLGPIGLGEARVLPPLSTPAAPPRRAACAGRAVWPSAQDQGSAPAHPSKSPDGSECRDHSPHSGNSLPKFLDSGTAPVYAAPVRCQHGTYGLNRNRAEVPCRTGAVAWPNPAMPHLLAGETRRGRPERRPAALQAGMEHSRGTQPDRHGAGTTRDGRPVEGIGRRVRNITREGNNSHGATTHWGGWWLACAYRRRLVGSRRSPGWSLAGIRNAAIEQPVRPGSPSRHSRARSPRPPRKMPGGWPGQWDSQAQESAASGQFIANFAMQFQGYPYAYAGNTPPASTAPASPSTSSSTPSASTSVTMSRGR